MTREAYGAGEMREDPTRRGVWRLRVFIGRDPLTGRRRFTNRTVRGSEKDARKALARLLTEVQDSRPTAESITVEQLLERWIDHITPQRTPATIAGYRSKIRARINPGIGKVRLAELSPLGLDTWYRQLADTGLSPATVRQCHAIVSAACNQAVRWDLLERSPADSRRVTTPRVPRQRVPDPPTADQVAAWVRQAEADGDRVLATAAALAAVTGMRRGELVALRWSDVDLEAGVVEVGRSVTRVPGRLVEGETKTHQVRRLALGPLGVEVVRLHQGWQRQLSAAAASPLVADPRLLSYRADGGAAISPDTLTHRWRELTGGACRLHDLRHFAATVLVAAGVDVRTVAARLGHAQATMTLNRYAHGVEDRDREAAEVIGRMLTPAAGATTREDTDGS